jgi:hypothetical protein
MIKPITYSSGFRGYRTAMQFHGIDREIFEENIIAAKRQVEFEASFRFGSSPVKRKYKPLVYGKN